MIIAIRSVVFFILMVINTLIFGLVMALTGWILSFDINSRIANNWGKFNLFLLRYICKLNYSITGIENIPESGCIIMSKHQSAWETIALRGLLPPSQAWVLKRELMYIPVFGWALAVVGPIAIDRSSGRQAVKQIVEQGIARLEQGRNVIIFPEGTRVAPGQRKRYGIGGGLLAHKAPAYPVIPIAHNAGLFWGRRGLNKYPGTIEVVIGAPIDTTGMSATRIMQVTEEWIEDRVAKLPDHI